MDSEHVRQARSKRPFQPFTIRLSDGRALWVRHPEFIAVAPNIVIVIGEDGYSVSHIDPFLIVSLDYQDRNKGALKV